MEPALLVLLLIAFAWGVYLIPPLLNSRRDTPLASTQEYDRVAARLSNVQETQVMPVSRTQVLTRRRRTLVLVSAVAVGTLVYAVAMQSVTMLLLNLAVDAIGAWYVAMLLQIKQARQVTRIHPQVEEVADVHQRSVVKIAAG